jgi:hypothetical protein
MTPWTSEHQALLKAFVLLVNGFRREEYRQPMNELEDHNDIRAFLKQNARSISPELLSISTKAQRGTYCEAAIETACILFESMAPIRGREKREIKVIHEVCSKVCNYF